VVKVVTEAGVVFLLGIVTQAEADAAVEIARTTGGVLKVVRVFEIISPEKAAAMNRTDHICAQGNQAGDSGQVERHRLACPFSPAFEAKIVDPADLAGRVARLPRPLVFTNGCFDILHRGHVTYLAQARALGAALIVAVNSDASVRRLGKGDDRPVNPLADRMALLAALECVSLVTWFDEDTPLARILECRPEVLVKGGDWPVERIVGYREVSDWGGSVHSIPFIHQRSTTALMEKIRKL
jgi:rfaE bifunctional protein nucleotidyltransferase chain/domain